MSTSPVVIDTFGGLDLSDDPEQVGLNSAVDMANIDPAELAGGRLSQRPGTSLIRQRTGFQAGAVVLYTSGAEYALVNWRPTASGSSQVEVIATQTGSVLATFTSSSPASSFVKVGTPSSSAIYFIAPAQMHKWNGSAFSLVTTPGTATAGPALSPVDNRLVYAEVTKVWFSDPGAPETFGVNNYVDLDPGDGESVHELVTWRDEIFAFKRSKFFVFTNTSTGPTGGPIFNYRSVRAGIGAWDVFADSAGAGTRACAGPDGVYFVGRDGVYRTTGDLPVLVSGQIRGWFDQAPLPLSSSLPSFSAGPTLTADERYVYLATAADSPAGTFVFDTHSGAWSYWALRITGRATPFFGPDSQHGQYDIVSNDTKVSFLSARLPDDDGTPITWAYRTGASDLGSPQQKVIRGARAWGNGTPTLSVYTDHATTDPGAAPVMLATAPAVTQGIQSFSRKGTFFSVGLSGTGPATIHRAELDVRDVRLPGTS